MIGDCIPWCEKGRFFVMKSAMNLAINVMGMNESVTDREKQSRIPLTVTPLLL